MKPTALLRTARPVEGLEALPKRACRAFIEGRVATEVVLDAVALAGVLGGAARTPKPVHNSNDAIEATVSI